MTLSDGRTATLHVGDLMNLTDDHQYRVLKIFAPSGPIVFKRTNAPTVQLTAFFCALLPTLSSALLKWSICLHKLTPHLLQLTTPLLKLCLTLLTLIIKVVLIVWAMFIGSRCLKPSLAVFSSLWDTN